VSGVFGERRDRERGFPLADRNNVFFLNVIHNIRQIMTTSGTKLSLRNIYNVAYGYIGLVILVNRFANRKQTPNLPFI